MEIKALTNSLFDGLFTQTSLITVLFDNKQLLIVNYNNEPFVPMKPVVEAIGLVWAGQYEKLKANIQKFNYVDIHTVAQDGKRREMFCIPLKKLNGWLFSINPNKVSPEIANIIIHYQEECFNVLYDYWHKGFAINPNTTNMTFLSEDSKKSMRMLITRRAKELETKEERKFYFKKVYLVLNEHFNINTYHMILESQFDEAMDFIKNIPLTKKFLLGYKKRHDYPDEKINLEKENPNGQEGMTPEVLTNDSKPAVEYIKELTEQMTIKITNTANEERYKEELRQLKLEMMQKNEDIERLEYDLSCYKSDLEQSNDLINSTEKKLDIIEKKLKIIVDFSQKFTYKITYVGKCRDKKCKEEGEHNHTYSDCFDGICLQDAVFEFKRKYFSALDSSFRYLTHAEKLG